MEKKEPASKPDLASDKALEETEKDVAPEDFDFDYDEFPNLSPD